mgnify:CR=1 FL=1
MKLLMRDEAKGREHTIFVTIFSALMVMLAIVVMLMASATAISGVTLQLDENAVDILDKQVENRAGYIQDQLQQAQELTDLRPTSMRPPSRCWTGAWSARWYPRIRSWPAPGRSPACGRPCPMRTAPSCPNLAKRPLKKLFVEDLKLHTVSEQYGSLLRIAAGELGDTNAGQQDEKYISRVGDWRYATRDMEEPQTAESWRTMPQKAAEWWKKVNAGEIENPFIFEHSNEPEDYEF